jgi:ABC-2 type transport system ATP-binding protein
VLLHEGAEDEAGAVVQESRSSLSSHHLWPPLLALSTLRVPRRVYALPRHAVKVRDERWRYGYDMYMSTDTNLAIQTRALTKHYGKSGEIKALQSLNLEIKQGELFGFLGPNGAGKSTTIRTLLGFLHATSGSASVLGLDVVKDSVEIRRRVGYLPSGFAVYDYMSGREYLDHMRELSGRPSLLRHRIMEALELSDAILKRPVRDYSRGMRQKIGVVQAMETDPELLILDEPSEGLDPLMQRSLQELLLERVALGRTVFFSSHLISEVERICNRVAIVRGGQLVALESVESLVRFRRRRIEALVARKPLRLTASAGISGLRVEAEGKSGFRISCDAEASAIPAFIKRLQSAGLRDLLVEAASLEEAFMSYYGNSTRNSVQMAPEAAAPRTSKKRAPTKRTAAKRAPAKRATKKRVVR